MTDQQRLRRLVRLGHTCVLIVTPEEDYALSVVRDVALGMNRPLWLWSAGAGARDGLVAGPPNEKTQEPRAGLAFLSAKEPHAICALLDYGAYLREPRTLRLLRESITQFAGCGRHLILIDHSDQAPDVLKSEASSFELSLPDEAELERIARAALRGANQERPISIDISRRGFDAILRNLRGLTRRQAERVILDAVLDDRRFDDADVGHVLAAKRAALQASGPLQFVESPADLAGIGGLRRLKRWLQQRAAALSPEAKRFGVSAPRGVLMLGVQGAGKSLCAKAIAAAWQRPLLRLDVGSLYDRYVGESEGRLRAALRQAEAMAPIILWIDEIEKGFASAAAQSVDGGLSKRMFGALLTWMQEHEAPVFIVATANDIEALPPELLRKGRFDEVFFVDLPDEGVRREILAIHLRRRGRDPAAFDLDAAARATEGFSGAELEQVVIAALHDAFGDRAELDTARLLHAAASSPPLSVTMAERVARLRAWAKGRCTPAD